MEKKRRGAERQKVKKNTGKVKERRNREERLKK